MSVTQVGLYTDSLGNGIGPRIEGPLGITVINGVGSGESITEIKARFDADGRAGKANLIRGGHNPDADIDRRSESSVMSMAPRTRTAVAAMMAASERAIVFQLGTSTASAYATTGLFLWVRNMADQVNAGYAADYTPAQYCRIHDRLLARAAALPDLTAQDRADLDVRLLPARWRKTPGEAGDGHYNEAGKDQAAAVYVEHINQYQFLATAPPVTPPPTSTLPLVPARQAQAAVDVFGMNTHFTYQSADDTNSFENETVDLVIELGVQLVRQRISTNREPRAAHGRLHAAGIRTVVPMLTLEQAISLAEAQRWANIYLDEIQNNPAVYNISLIAVIAGVNEPNGDAPAFPDWAQRTRWAQQAIYEETRSRPAFAKVIIQGPPLSRPVGNRVPPGGDWQAVLRADVASMGQIGQWADRADAHIYPGERDPLNGPTTGPSEFFDILAGMYAGESFAVTEAGWFNATPQDGITYTGGSRATPESVTAIYAPKLPLTYLLLGQGPVMAYEMLNNQPPWIDTSNDVRASTFGYIETPQLAPSSWRRKAQFDAMRRYLTRLRDPGVPFTPAGRRMKVTGGGPDLHYLLFQRRSGAHVLALWRSVDLYAYNVTTNTGNLIEPASVDITVTLDAPVTVTVYKPSVQDAPTQSLGQVSSFVQAVGKHVHLIDLPVGAAGTAPPPPPPPDPTQPVVLADTFTGLTAQDLAPPRGSSLPPFRFLDPVTRLFGWRNNGRAQNTGDAGIVAAGARGGINLPSRVANRRTAGGASYIGVDTKVIPDRWKVTFGYDPGGAAGPWKIGMHLWDSLTGAAETVPGHFSIRYAGWGFDAGNLQTVGPLLTPFGGNANNQGNTAGSSGTWPNGPLAVYDGTPATLYTMTIEKVGPTTLRFVFPAQTGQAPITISDDRLAVIAEKGVCQCVWESERRGPGEATMSLDFMTRYEITLPAGTIPVVPGPGPGPNPPPPPHPPPPPPPPAATTGNALLEWWRRLRGFR